jgi:hypothetical protein
MTLLKFINYFILQWFFIRLCKEVNNEGLITNWGIMTKVYPLSGWNNSYKFIGEPITYWFK